MNCFNTDNTTRAYNYLSLMKNNMNEHNKNEFDALIQNIENKFL